MENSNFKNVSSIGDFDNKSSKLKRKPMFDDRGSLQNGVKLMFEKGFGFNQCLNVSSNAHCIDDNKIIYILAKQIVLYDMLTERQHIVDTIGQEDQITCFKYFKNMMLDDNILYSFYASCKSYPTIVIKNFSKGQDQRYVMTHLQKEQKILFLDLVNDNKHICIVSELQENYRYSLIDIFSKQVYSTDGIYFKVKGMVVPYSNDKIIIAYNENELYQINIGQQVKPINLKFNKILGEDQTIVEVITSMQNELTLFAITNKANLYYITINVSQHKITKNEHLFLGMYETVSAEGKVISTNKMPSSICCNQYNILIGFFHIEEFTLVKINALSNLNSQIEQIKFSCPFLHKITKMTFAHETMAVCVTVQVKQNDKYDLSIPIQSDYLKEKGEIKVVKQNINNHLLPPGKIFPVVFNLLLHDTLVETLRSPIQSVLTSTLFVQKILDICLIPTKKIFLILSAQKKIKAIKYEHTDSMSFERMLAWECIFNSNDNPTSIDAHPLTFNVAVGFKEGLKLFIICSEGLRASNIQFPFKNCETVRYSKYGHKLIAGSLNQLIIINPYQNRIINTIQFNSGYMMKELSFLDKDLFIHGVFANGCSMVMNNQGNKLFQVWNKNSKAICSVFDSVFDIMAVSYPDSITKFFRDRGTQQFAVMWTYPYNITKFLIVNEIGTIFMGTSMGKIKAHQWPFTDSMKFSKLFTEIQLHSSAVTELKISPDYNLLISGAEDGSIFISRIIAHSDGIAVSDPEVLSSFKSNYKNYKSLYYLQNYMNTSISIENSQEEIIGQLESDKADFDTEYNDIISTIQESIDKKIKTEEEKKNKELKDQMAPLEQLIDKLNEKKGSARQEINNVLKLKSEQQFTLEEQKLVKIRQLYKETDHLNEKKQFYTNCYSQETNQLKESQKKQFEQLINDFSIKQEKIMKECQEIQKQYEQNIVHYKQLMKEETIQGEIYKEKMIEELRRQLQQSREDGENLRKKYNKLYHENNNYEQKMKYFQQLMAEIQIDTENSKAKYEVLQTQLKYLEKILSNKDKQILNEQKNVKELLSNNINNYTHEEYLKHKKQELLNKAKYLENQIQELDKKYYSFEENFSQTSKEANDLNKKISNSMDNIRQLKNREQEVKQKAYLRKYKQHLLYNQLLESYHNAQNSEDFKHKIKDILINIDSNIEPSAKQEPPVDIAVGKRDHLIKQVVNSNNLRKIDDTIRRTIMIKLNRETVSLTCEVNELRKEKKIVAARVRELQFCLKQLKQVDGFKQNSSVQDIVPANISIIRGQTSKNLSTHRLLPFQLYHHNKSNSKLSNHSKQYGKMGQFDQSSTQLPSLMKNNFNSSHDSSGLFGVEQIDEIAQ